MGDGTCDHGNDATLADLVDARDAECFVGRIEHLDRIDAALDGHSDRRVLLVHGPAGVGKSALLRAAARRATGAGRPVRWIDARTLARSGEDGHDGPAPALVIVDDVDVATTGTAGQSEHELRDALLATTPADAVVLVAGRRRPGRDWSGGGLEHLVSEIELPPLDQDDLATLVERCRLHPDLAPGVVERSRGFPVVVALAAELAAGQQEDPSGDRLGPLLLARLCGDELDPIDPSVLEVAAIAPTVDPRLLAAALPGRRTRGAMAELRSTSLVTAVGNRLSLHPLVRDVLRGQLIETDADRCRGLVLRVAAHLRSRALTEDVRLVLELADLVEEPAIRLGWAPSRTHVADRLRPGDVARARTVLDGSPWRARLDRWAAEEPSSVLVVRDVRSRTASAIGVVNRGDRLPDWAGEDPDLGPMVEHARGLGRLERSSFLHKLVIVADEPPDAAALAEIVRVGNSGAVTRGLAGNARYGYVTDVVRRAGDGTEALGYERISELDRTDGPLELFTMVTDFGPDGIVGMLDAIVRTEQGDLDPGADGDVDREAGRSADLVTALRSFHDDDALASLHLSERCPDAATAGAVGRADFVRDELRAAIDAAFDDADDDLLLRRALERTYLDPDGGHARARRELHMSRSSFFRHLARARERVARH